MAVLLKTRLCRTAGFRTFGRCFGPGEALRGGAHALQKFQDAEFQRGAKKV
jgi:hypothetical protein